MDRRHWISVVVACAATIVGSMDLARLALAQETYVKISGSTSTGLQVFSGKNGQIRLPPGGSPAFPLEGMINNFTGTGLMVYKSGAWELIGSGSSGSGVYVATGPTTGATVTALAASSGLAWSTSGVTGTIAPTYGVSASTVMQGNQQLDGDLAGGITTSYLRPSGTNLQAGDMIAASSSTVGAPANVRVPAGNQYQFLGYSSGMPVAREVNVAAVGGASYSRLTSSTLSNTSTFVQADFIDAVDASGRVCRVLAPSQTINLSINGSGGLDTGSQAIDKVYYKWLLVKSDLSAYTFVASIAGNILSVTLPSGYTGCFSRYVGPSITKHTSTALFAMEQRDDVVTPGWATDAPINSDGGQFVTASTATGTQNSSYALRCTSWTKVASFKVQMSALSSNNSRWIYLMDPVSNVAIGLVQCSATTNGSGVYASMVTMATDSPGTFTWSIQGSGGTPQVFIAIGWFQERI